MSLQKQFLKSKQACKVTFSLPEIAASGAKEVTVLGDFNNWEKENGLPMKLENGCYEATTNLTPGREYEFRYLMDGESWENDWAADKYYRSPFGVENSVVVVPADAEVEK